MKKKIIFVFLMTLLFMSFHCSTATHPNLNNHGFDPNKDVIAVKENGVLKLAVSQGNINASAKKADDNWKTIKEISLIESDEKTAYLVLKGISKKDGSMLKAVVLTKVEGEQYKLINNGGTVTHSCTEHCCQECEFNMVDGKIKGCKCVRLCPIPAVGDGFCGHSISTSVEGALQPLGN